MDEEIVVIRAFQRLGVWFFCLEDLLTMLDQWANPNADHPFPPLAKPPTAAFLSYAMPCYFVERTEKETYITSEGVTWMFLYFYVGLIHNASNPMFMDNEVQACWRALAALTGQRGAEDLPGLVEYSLD